MINEDSTFTFCIEKEEDEIRLDKLLKNRFSSYSRTYFQYLIENQSVTINGKGVKKGQKPKQDDEIEIFFLHSPEIDLLPQPIPLEILYEDEDIICVNKPAGMVVHPAPGHAKDTFVNALLYHCRSLEREEETIRPGIVHRLDKETSGVLLAAKTIKTHQKLIEAFSQRKVHKKYLAITIGCPGERRIEAPIGRHPTRRKEMAIREEDGREAITLCKPLKKGDIFSLVEIEPITGRTHQIRLHLKSINTPILGDAVYGSERVNRRYQVPRQLLHAHTLTFRHPIQKNSLTITAPLPKEIEVWIEKID
jgi:23S rRNA pseudouridine1911/1915/1917 synthase